MECWSELMIELRWETVTRSRHCAKICGVRVTENVMIGIGAGAVILETIEPGKLPRQDPSSGNFPGKACVCVRGVRPGVVDA